LDYLILIFIQLIKNILSLIPFTDKNKPKMLLLLLKLVQRLSKILSKFFETLITHPFQLSGLFAEQKILYIVNLLNLSVSCTSMLLMKSFVIIILNKV